MNVPSLRQICPSFQTGVFRALKQTVQLPPPNSAMATSFMLFLIFILSVSGSKIITYKNDYLIEQEIIDLTTDGSSVTLYVRYCETSVMDGGITIVNMTKYCYCTESTLLDPLATSCSVPGPTLKMHEYTRINVTVVNELEGDPETYNQESGFWNKYKDMDITNLHVHGLHVSPRIDDILVRIPNVFGSYKHLYQYRIGYHYPGLFWYHAHHHVK